MNGLAPSPRPAGCPSDLTLEELHTGDLAGDPRERSLRLHLDGCTSCQARVALAASVPPPPMSVRLRAEALALAAPPRPQPQRRLATRATVGFAAAAAVVLVAMKVRTPESATTERTKGGLALTVVIKRASGEIDRVAGEGQLRAGEEMSFALQATQAGRVVVLGLDAAPSVTLYAPFSGPGEAVLGEALSVRGAMPELLPGSIVADARPGTERVFAVLCPPSAPLSPATVRERAQAALARAGGRPEAVTSLGTACAEASVLLTKEPPTP